MIIFTESILILKQVALVHHFEDNLLSYPKII